MPGVRVLTCLGETVRRLAMSVVPLVLLAAACTSTGTATTTPVTAASTAQPATPASSDAPSSDQPTAAQSDTSVPVAPTTGDANPPTAAATTGTGGGGGSGTCSIRSSAGNCYRAGEFCRNSDLGNTTTDAAGRSITCGIESGKPHWHY